MDSHQLDRSEYVLRARFCQSTLQVDVPKLLNNDVLPDQPSVLGNTVCEAFWDLWELMGVELTDAEDVVKLVCLLRGLVKRFEYFLDMFHILENKCLRLIKH
jgi:hypothetical protein